MEIRWTESCLGDIGSENDFLKVKNFLERSMENLHIRTKQIKSVDKNVRRLRIGNKRLFLFFKKEFVFAIAYLDRKDAYKNITIKNLKLLIKN